MISRQATTTAENSENYVSRCPTTTLTWRSAKMPLKRDEHRYPQKATLLRLARSVVYIIITNATRHNKLMLQVHRPE